MEQCTCTSTPEPKNVRNVQTFKTLKTGVKFNFRNVNAQFGEVGGRKTWWLTSKPRDEPGTVESLRSAVPGRTDSERQTLAGGIVFHVRDQLMRQHAGQQTLL